MNANQKRFFFFTLNSANASSFSQYSNYSLYVAKNRHCLTDDFLLVSRFHCEHHQFWRKQIVPPLSPLLQNPLTSSYSTALPSRIYSWTCPQLPEILVLFSSSLVTGSPWIFLALYTLSSHVLADFISNSGPADWLCNWNSLRCTSIWVVLGLDSLSKCYTNNSYSAHWPCYRNPPQTAMSWLVMLCVLWHPFFFQKLIYSFTLCH